MGTWSVWHFIVFILVACVGAWVTRSSQKGRPDRSGPGPKGYGGWLLALSAFLIFWATQELGEFYRVKTQIALLIPSALNDLSYIDYIGYAQAITWFQAILLALCIVALFASRSSIAIKAVIAVLWVAGPLSASAELLLTQSYFGDYIVEHDFSSLAATLLFSTVFTWYFLVSRRVRNTYP
ncbi:MAG: DUF2569 family protein [Burkholderiaceae bacterium]